MQKNILTSLFFFIFRHFRNVYGPMKLKDCSYFWFYCNCPWTRGHIHPGQVTSLSQDQHRKTNNHSHQHLETISSRQFTNAICVFLECCEKTQRKHTVYNYFSWLKNYLFGEVTSVIKWWRMWLDCEVCYLIWASAGGRCLAWHIGAAASLQGCSRIT